MENDEALSQSLLNRRPIRRVALACIQCRSRKVKCDATQPICTRCHVDGKTCEYQKSRRGGRPRRPAAGPVQSPDQVTQDDPDPADSDPITSQWTEIFSSSDNISSGRGLSGSSSHSTAGSALTNLTTPSSSDHSAADALDIGASFDSWTFATTLPGLNGLQVDQLLTLYYDYFHVSHPCVLPSWSLQLRVAGDPNISEYLVPVLLYIGSIFSTSTPSEPLAELAFQKINNGRARGACSSPYYVQALMLYAIAVYWNNEPDRGRAILDEAIQVALNLGMHRFEFAGQYGMGDLVLEESWRRTWWQLYVTDAHIAGSTHGFPTKTGAIMDITTGLPCEEVPYSTGQIPPPPSLRSYDIREFSEVEFSSFAHFIGFTQGINRVLATRRRNDPAHHKSICANADTMMTAWCSLLPKNKRRLIRDDGSVDELLFKANLLMHTYIVDLHRELSNLKYSAIESISMCAPPPPPEFNNLIKEDAHTHTSKVLFAVEKLNGLLTLPTRFATHTPFIICMIANMTIAHLSACRYLFQEPRLSIEREKIRLNMGVLKMLGEFWPAGHREYRDIGTIAREILSIREEEIQIPEMTPIMPLDTLDFNFDFDVNWACDVFSNGPGAGPGAPAAMNMDLLAPC
ncbi:hypothetical protein B0J11DRAFT_71435 [Dendryphion nanum]|uniref:Zn(2)-C6 fungal-type domain-containing protein n=1 Tax=Dendryphion nanum TaxID=256645 RepID=A0A9P9DIZ2_9PLEO|nr:hypothetical protein B0J11DRAFT_71435 [Dendryphion nanum]